MISCDAGLALDTLSMGMTADLEAAIHAGGTMVRVGTAILAGDLPRLTDQPPFRQPPSRAPACRIRWSKALQRRWWRRRQLQITICL